MAITSKNGRIKRKINVILNNKKYELAANEVSEKIKTHIASIKRSNRNVGWGGGGGRGGGQQNSNQKRPWDPNGYCWTHFFASNVTTIVKPAQPGNPSTKRKQKDMTPWEVSGGTITINLNYINRGSTMVALI